MSWTELPPRPTTWGQRLDGWISALFPRWGADRALYRQLHGEVEALSRRGARSTRLDGPRGTEGRPDYQSELTGDRRALVDNARRLERESAIAEALLSRSVEHAVGCGFPVQAKTASDSWNDRAEGLWKDWSEQGADVRGLCTFDDLLALAHRSKLRDGDVAALFLKDGSLQFIESDQISSPHGDLLRKGFVDGVELDKRGRPLAFHVVDDPDPVNASVRYQPHTRIPADAVNFLARRQRLGQTRGMSAFANVIWLIEQMEGQIEAVTVAARMAACFGLVLKKKGRTGGLPGHVGRDGVSRRKMSVMPGSIQEIGHDEDVVQIKPDQPGTNWPDFIATTARLIGVPFGLPLEVSLMDMTRSNYSQARGALLMAQRVWRRDQRDLKVFASKVYRWKVISWMEQGLLPVRADALSHRWVTPGFGYLDPVKEVQAIQLAVDAGLNTLSGAALADGLDFDEVSEARARELRRMDSLGIPRTFSTLTRPDPTEAPAAAPPLEE